MIGIDPSLACTAIVVLHKNQARELYAVPRAHAEPHCAMMDATHTVRNVVNAVMQRAMVARLDKPTVAIEVPTLQRTGALWSAGLYCSIFAAVASARVVAVHPIQLKKFVLGSVKGGKDEVRLAVFKRWGFEHASHDVVDAYALARIAQAVASESVRADCTLAQRQVVERVLGGGRGGKRTRRMSDLLSTTR